jgi:hypothetical protein
MSSQERRKPHLVMHRAESLPTEGKITQTIEEPQTIEDWNSVEHVKNRDDLRKTLGSNKRLLNSMDEDIINKLASFKLEDLSNELKKNKIDRIRPEEFKTTSELSTYIALIAAVYGHKVIYDKIWTIATSMTIALYNYLLSEIAVTTGRATLRMVVMTATQLFSGWGTVLTSIAIGGAFQMLANRNKPLLKGVQEGVSQSVKEKTTPYTDEEQTAMATQVVEDLKNFELSDEIKRIAQLYFVGMSTKNFNNLYDVIKKKKNINPKTDKGLANLKKCFPVIMGIDYVNDALELEKFVEELKRWSAIRSVGRNRSSSALFDEPPYSFRGKKRVSKKYRDKRKKGKNTKKKGKKKGGGCGASFKKTKKRSRRLRR